MLNGSVLIFNRNKFGIGFAVFILSVFLVREFGLNTEFYIVAILFILGFLGFRSRALLSHLHFGVFCHWISNKLSDISSRNHKKKLVMG